MISIAGVIKRIRNVVHRFVRAHQMPLNKRSQFREVLCNLIMATTATRLVKLLVSFLVNGCRDRETIMSIPALVIMPYGCSDAVNASAFGVKLRAIRALLILHQLG